MEFKITMPMDAIRELARKCIEALNRDRTPVRTSIGPRLLDAAQTDFDRKASGATGVDGIRWAPDSPETARAKRSRLIGVESGDMRDSLRVTYGGSDGSDVALEYTADHAGFFDQRRPLLPDEMPDAWAGAIEEDAHNWATRTVQGQIDNFQS